jgi:uncharacterized protein (TIGR02172 family)
MYSFDSAITIIRVQRGTMPPLNQRIAVGRTAEVYAWENNQVLKLFRDWCPPDWVDYEARICRLVNDAGVPSPRVGDIIEVDGRRGILYERVDGLEMLAAMSRDPLKIVEYARMLACLHVEMHRCAGGDLPSMSVRTAGAIHAAKALPGDLRERSIKTLAALPDGDRLCHGDFHPGNVILTSRGPLIIDWMTAAQGHPAADVARTRLLCTVGDPPQGGLVRLMVLAARGVFRSEYLKAYRAAAPEIVEQSEAFLPTMAAARLNEEIAPEREQVLRMARGG